MWEDPDMTLTSEQIAERLKPVRAAAKRMERADQALKAAREKLAEEIAGAMKDGVRPVDLLPAVPYDREHLRRIARAHDVPLLREPTVVSKRRTSE